MWNRNQLWRMLLSVAVMFAFFGSLAMAQDAEVYFQQNCMSCHTIGGGTLTGPDLKGVETRRDRAWLVKFMQDPAAMIQSGDAYAQQLAQGARGVIMPKVSGMTPDMAEALLRMIDRESKDPNSRFKGLQISERPFTPMDVAMGRDYFRGIRALENGGAACISCHGTHDLGFPGGGKLGPDLTRVYERLQGRKGLSTWLSAPATSTMQANFKTHPLKSEEILALAAYLDSVKDKTEANVGAFNASIGLMAVAITGSILALFDGIWRHRFRGVRKPLVYGATGKGGKS